MRIATETPAEAVAWKAGRYVYCLSHWHGQVIGPIEYLTADGESLWDGKQCDWCGKRISK